MSTSEEKPVPVFLMKEQWRKLLDLLKDDAQDVEWVWEHIQAIKEVLGE